MKRVFFRLVTAMLLLFFLCSLNLIAQRRMETPDRGVVAVKVGGGVFVSWRVFGDEYLDVAYNLYRGGEKLNADPITGATNFLDAGGSISSTYSVAAVVKGVEQPASAPVAVWGSNYLEVPLQVPPGGTTPDAVNYTYSANDCSVGDLDGDGQYEIILKWDPSNSRDNSQEGYTGNVLIDAYKLDGTRMWRIDLGINIRAGAHYTQFMVYDLDGDGKAEMACKTADGTKDGAGTIIGSPTADYRNDKGYILSGPEFLTVFNGETGAAMKTVNYIPARGDVSSWGDSYGNRVDRFLACIAYLDGQNPSLVMCRGYYTRTVLAAWDWKNNNLTSRWVFDSNNPGYSSYAGQGNHNLSVADVDDDGKDEIIYGACAIDDNGTGLWTTGYGHGDAMHVSDILPSRPGLERWGIHEGTGTPGSALLDARTGETLWKTPNADVGRGVSADLTAAFPGMECWGGTSGLRSAENAYAGSSPSSTNHVIWWDRDDLRELLDGNTISKYNVGAILSATGCSSINGTKSNPCLQADLLGDWREEVIFRTSDNTALRIYTTVDITDRRLYTLMHDPQYRLSVAWQNVAYNQPPHTGFFLGHGMSPAPLPPVMDAKLLWFTGTTWDINTSQNWKQGDALAYYNEGDDVLFDLSGSNANPVNLIGILHPSAVTVHSPKDYIFNGPGSLAGGMDLLKAGPGKLTLNGDHTYSGKTSVLQGTLVVNGTLGQSPVETSHSATIGGAGTLGKGLTVRNYGRIIVAGTGTTDTLKVSDYLDVQGNVTLFLDLSADTSGLSKPNDILVITGDLTLNGNNTIEINPLEGYLESGAYTLIRFTGTFAGVLSSVQVAGIPGTPFELLNTGNAIVLKIGEMRDPARIVWKGGGQNIWDFLGSQSWLNNGMPDYFVAGDSVRFDDTAVPNTSVTLAGVLPVSELVVDASANYTFGGSGTVSGPGGIIKNGTGKLSILTLNNYTGPTVLNSGYLDIPGMSNAGQPGPLGTGNVSPAGLVIRGGEILVSGSISSSNRGLTLDGSGGTFNITSGLGILTLSGEITGGGQLIKAGDGILTLEGVKTYTGGTVIRKGVLKLGNEEANISGLGSGTVIFQNGILSMLDNLNSTTAGCNWNMTVPAGFSGTLNLDSRCSLTGSLYGSGTLYLYSPFIRSELAGDWSAFSGQISVSTDADGGFFLVANEQGYGKASLSLADNVTLLFRNSRDAVIEIGALSGSSLSVLGAGGEGSNNITWVVGGRNVPAVFSGQINNTQFKNTGARASIVKTGSADWTLTNANTFTGGTVVNGGILTVNNTAGSGTGSGPVTVNAGAALRGTGTIAGALTLNSQASLSVGTGTQTAIFTVINDASLLAGSAYSVKVNPVTQASDRLVVTGKLVLAGNLFISKTVSGNFIQGQAFRIVDAQNCSGKFATIVPLVPGSGLQWDTTGICTTGYLRVIETPNGITPDETSAFVGIYPNPVNDILRVVVDDPGLAGFSGDLYLTCYNYQGTVHLLDRLSPAGKSYEKELDISALPGGVYVLVINGADRSYISRFIKQ